MTGSRPGQWTQQWDARHGVLWQALRQALRPMGGALIGTGTSSHRTDAAVDPSIRVSTGTASTNRDVAHCAGTVLREVGSGVSSNHDTSSSIYLCISGFLLL